MDKKTIKKIKEKIANNDIRGAILFCKAYFQKHEQDDQYIILLENRFNRLRSDKISGVLSNSDYSRETNKIINDFQEYIKSLSEKDKRSKIITKSYLRAVYFFIFSFTLFVILFFQRHLWYNSQLMSCPDDTTLCRKYHDDLYKLNNKYNYLETDFINLITGVSKVQDKVIHDNEKAIEEFKILKDRLNCEQCIKSQIYINGTGLCYSYLRLIMSQEDDSNNIDELVKLSKEAISSAEETMSYIQNIHLSSESCQQELNEWLVLREHNHRYNMFLFLSYAFNFKYDDKTIVSIDSIQKTYKKIPNTFIVRHGFDNYLGSDIIHWLSESKIISIN